MNEIEKCPICGGVPLDKWDVTSVRVFQTGQACCGVDCNTNELWNQYAAAMEYAKKTAYWFGLPGGVDHQEDARAEQAMRDAETRVLEVFK